MELRPLSVPPTAGSAGKKGRGGAAWGYCGVVMGILWDGEHGDSMGSLWGMGTV